MSCIVIPPNVAVLGNPETQVFVVRMEPVGDVVVIVQPTIMGQPFLSVALAVSPRYATLKTFVYVVFLLYFMTLGMFSGFLPSTNKLLHVDYERILYLA